MNYGPYEVVRELGRGGMGAVLAARGPDGRPVAIKVLLRPNAKDALDRFQREARLQAEPIEGFVPLLDSGVGARGEPYLVMPLLHGGTLRNRLREPMSVDDALALGRSLADAIGRAHARGIVHRDLKPENVLFDAPAPGGRPLIADLGLAKHWDGSAPGASQSVMLSRSGEMRGTAGYAAPEQISSARDVGPPADVFALATMLYEALAGEPPFRGDSIHELIARVLGADLAPLRSRRPDVPRWLSDAVALGLSREPGRRPPDGAAFAATLVAPPPPPLAARLLPALIVTAALVVLGAALVAMRPAEPAPPAPDAPTSAPDVPAPPVSPPPVVVETPLEEVRRLVAPGERLKLEAVHGSTRWATPGWSHGLAASPDGRTFVAGGNHGFVLVCDAETGVTRRAMHVAGGSYVGCVGFDATGTRVLAVADRTSLTIFDVATGEVVGRAAGRFLGAAFVDSPEPRVLLIEPEALTLRGFGPGAPTVKRAALALDGGSVAVLPGGRLGLVGTPAGAVLVWDLDAFEQRAAIALGDAPVSAIGVGHGGQSMAAHEQRAYAADKAGGVWRVDPAAGTATRIATLPDKDLAQLALLPHGRLAVAGYAPSHLAHLLDPTSGTVMATLGHASSVTGLAFAGGAILSCDRELHRVRRWAPDDAHELVAQEQGGRVYGLDVAGEDLCTTTVDGRLRARDRAGRSRVVADLGPSVLHRVRAAPGQPGAAFVSGKGAWKVDLAAGTTARLPDRAGRAAVVLRALAVAPGPPARVITAGEDGTARVYDLAGSTTGAGGGVSTSWIYDLVLDDEGLFAIYATDRGGQAFEVDTLGGFTGIPIAGASTDRARAVAILRDGRAAFVGHDDGTIERFDLHARAAEVLHVRHRDGVVHAIALSPDGRRAASASGDTGDDHTLRLWDVRTGREQDRLDLAPLGDFVSALRWSDDGQRLLAGTARGAVLEVSVAR